METQDRFETAPRRERRASRGWQIAWGVLLIIAGVLGVAMPFVAALATVFVFAWALIIGGWRSWPTRSTPATNRGSAGK